MNRIKRIAALVAVIAWLAMIAATMILAFINNETCHKLFIGLMITDIALPVVLYAIILVYRILSGRKISQE